MSKKSSLVLGSLLASIILSILHMYPAFGSRWPLVMALYAVPFLSVTLYVLFGGEARKAQYSLIAATFWSLLLLILQQIGNTGDPVGDGIFHLVKPVIHAIGACLAIAIGGFVYWRRLRQET